MIYDPYKPLDEPLTKSEQDDLFGQMEKSLKRGPFGIEGRFFLNCEVENWFRMMATIKVI